MIQELTTVTPYFDFAHSFDEDELFSHPYLTSDRVESKFLSYLNQSDVRVLGTFESGVMTGLFAVYLIESERYLEVVAALSRSARAYEELMGLLQAEYALWQADFFFNPCNALLKAALTQRAAEFDKEQQVMCLTEPVAEIDTTGIELLSDRYLSQYLALHNTDLYWTGERVVAEPEEFQVFLAVEGKTVVGYLDVRPFSGNSIEAHDLLVRQESRRQGWGRKLLTKAIEMNRPEKVELLADVDNIPAISLYTSLGFRVVPRQNNVTATWRIPS